MTRGFGRFIKALFVSYLHGRIISFSTKKSQSLAAHLNWSWLINKKNKSLWNNNHCCLWDRWLYHSMSHQLPMASTMKKHFFFSPGNLIYVKLTCTEVTPNAGQTAKEGKKGRNPSNVLSQVLNWAAIPAQWGWIWAHTSQERATNPHFRLSHFHLTVWGRWSCGTDRVLMEISSSNISFL